MFLLVLLVLLSSVSAGDLDEDYNEEYGEDYVVSPIDHSSGLSDISSVVSKKIEDERDNHHMAFLSSLDGCTGTLIHPEWIISASHCYPNELSMASQDEATKDKILDLKDEGVYVIMRHAPGSTKLKGSQFWTKPIEQPEKISKDMYGAFAKVDKMVFHPLFEDEAKSWKGGDVVLLHLSKERGAEIKGNALPICLPTHEFDDFGTENGKTFMAGFGRRRLAHCVTDMHGPEKFAICGRPVACSKDHRTRKCGLRFLYKGKTHTECIKDSTPSSENPICKNLAKGQKKDGIKETTYVLKKMGNKYKVLTICYRTKPPEKSKGWCTTREPMLDENEEPKMDSGWGFCSNEDDQKDCNKYITEVVNTDRRPVYRQDDQWCLDELMKNLKREQPDVTYDDIKTFPRLYCAGNNVSLPIEGDEFFLSEDENYTSFTKLDANEHQEDLKVALKEKFGNDAHAMDGGPACFGDSGGPMWKNIVDKTTGKTKPVLIGVFSFMLWGTCRGRHEPSYYGRVRDYLDFIYRHVPKEEVCTSADERRSLVQLRIQ